MLFKTSRSLMKKIRLQVICAGYSLVSTGLLLLSLILSGCTDIWNNPYPAADSGKNILYNVFAERPKHLDPVQSYSSNEIQLTSQIYQPPLQYHFLKRPLTLIPQTASRMPTVSYFDSNDTRLPANSADTRIAYSVYEISIRPGIFYQPHPAFARDEKDNLRYHELTVQDIQPIHKISDFEHTGTRELVADDYIYQIKRLAHPGLHSPIFGLMADYITGLREYANTLRDQARTRPGNSFLDLRDFPLTGVERVDDYTYRIRIKGKYPQFIYWLTMAFFCTDSMGSRSFLLTTRYGREKFLTRLVSGGNRSVHAGRK